MDPCVSWLVLAFSVGFWKRFHSVKVLGASVKSIQ